MRCLLLFLHCSVWPTKLETPVTKERELNRAEIEWLQGYLLHYADKPHLPTFTIKSANPNIRIEYINEFSTANLKCFLSHLCPLNMMAKNSILVLGAGELGTAILEALLVNEHYSSSDTSLTLLVRPSTISSPSPERKQQLDRFHSHSISLQSGDTDQDSLESLVKLFKPFTTVIAAGGFTLSEGAQLKLAKAVIAASVPLYFPWQYGLDYDAIGPKGGNGLFAEQCQVRDLLRSQSTTQWVILSVGIFTSFIFEDFWGVVNKHDDGTVKVTALNSLYDSFTTTAAEDIGKAVAELALNENEERNRAVFIAGDTLTYADLADLVAKASGREVIKAERPLKLSREDADKDPDNKLKKYWVAFSEGKGYSWSKERTWNAQRGIEMTDVKTWLAYHWRRLSPASIYH